MPSATPTQPEPEVDAGARSPIRRWSGSPRVLSRYPLPRRDQAYRNLMSLAEEKIRFLSTRRCRHFLAAIAPAAADRRLTATPDPDATLVNLEQSQRFIRGKRLAMGVV